jgi:PAS domain S-box-containing protein
MAGLVFILVLVIFLLIGILVWQWSLAQKQMDALRQEYEARIESKREQVQKVIESERSLLSNIMNNLPDAVFITNELGQYALSNKAHHTLLGYRHEYQVLGELPHELLGADKAQKLYQDNTHIKVDSLTQRQEFAYKTGDNIYWYQITRVPLLNEEGAFYGVLAIMHNITERQQTQEKLQKQYTQIKQLSEIDSEVNSTLDIEQVAMGALDSMLRLSQADTGFIAVLRGEELHIMAKVGNYQQLGSTVHYNKGITGRVLMDQTPIWLPAVSEDPDYVADVSKTKSLMSIPLHSQNILIGIVTLETSKPDRFTQSGFEFLQKVAGNIAIAIDNARLYEMLQAKLREAEQLYIQTQELLAEKSELEKIKTDMIRIASHDLKNPLAVIQGYVTLMALEPRDPEVEEFMGEIDKATKRMDNILKDILSLERIQQLATYVELDMQSLAQEAFEEFVTQARQKHQHLNFHCNLINPAFVKGDKTQVYEALVNLVGNAIKYTPAKGTVDVYLETTQKRLVFKVIDTGYGIPLDMQERLFEPFFRAKTEETIGIEGTGLGLHLVKNIIERHRGKMLFESEHGRGSLFGFELPLIT